MATTKIEFEAAVAQVNKFTKRPSNDELLQIYALYKQATEGDVQSKRPGLFDVKGRKKFDAWANQKGTAKQSAMEQYVALVQKLSSQYG